MPPLRPEEITESKWIAIGIGVLCLGGYLGYRGISGLLDGFGEGMCGSIKVREVPSPDGTVKLAEHFFDCGVGSDPNREFSLLAGPDPIPDSPGNAFRLHSERDWDPAPSHSPVQIRWRDNQHVEIIYPDDLEVFGYSPKVWLSVGLSDPVPIEVIATPRSKPRPLPVLVKPRDP